MLKNRFSGFAAMLLVVCMLLSGGCSAFSGQKTEKTTSTTIYETTQETPDASESDQKGTSGTLRIWWSRRNTLNPLLDDTQSGRDVNRLVFQSLYQIDEKQQCVPQLAGQMIVLDGGTRVLITIPGGIEFHDGSLLTAYDVEACLEFILGHEDHSSYARDLHGILEVSATDERTLQLILAQPDPWLAYSMIFPVIPAVYVNSTTFECIPGSGLFRMSRFSSEEGLVLIRTDETEQSNKLTTIRVIEYNGFTEAMQAFEHDEIDLVNLDADAYYQYQLRSSLRFDPYTTRQLILVACNTASRHPLTDPGRLLFIKRALGSLSVSMSDRKSFGGEISDVPVPALSFLLEEETSEVDNILNSLGEAEWDQDTRELVILVPQDGVLDRDMADALTGVLDANDINYRLKQLPSANYQDEFKLGSFDLALIEAIMPQYPNPAWLYGNNRPTEYDMLNILPDRGLEAYDTWRDKLISLLSVNKLSYLRTGGELAEVLAETSARSPFCVLLIRSGALLYGSRIVGQGKPVADNPYRGIEELWVWSG